MTLFKNKYRIESARRKGWDYRNPEHYFVTICRRGRNHYFDTLEQLPEPYTKDLYDQKCELVYQHVYEVYAGQSRNVRWAKSLHRSAPCHL